MLSGACEDTGAGETDPAQLPTGPSNCRAGFPSAERMDSEPGAAEPGRIPAGGETKASAGDHGVRSAREEEGVMGSGGQSLGSEAGRGGLHPLPSCLTLPTLPGRCRCRGCARWVVPETELSSLCLTPLFPPLSWSLSVGGGQTLGALPPAVQPPATTGVLRILLLHAGDRALPSPRQRRLLGLLRFPHSAQPLGGEQPRAGAPPAPRAPRRWQPQTRALGAPHLAVPAAAGVGPLHPQDLGWAPPHWRGQVGGGGGEQAETMVPSQEAIITHTHTPHPPHHAIQPLLRRPKVL